MENIPFKITIDDVDLREVLKSLGAVHRSLQEEQRAWEKSGKTAKEQIRAYKDAGKTARQATEQTRKSLDELLRRIEQLSLLPHNYSQEARLEISNLKDLLGEWSILRGEIGQADAGELDWWEQLGAHQDKINKAHELVKSGLTGIDTLFKQSRDNRISEAKQLEEQQIAQLDNLVLSEEEKESRIAQIKKESAEKQVNIDREYRRKQKKLQLTQAVISTAVGVTQALGGSPPPANFIQAAIVAATGAAEIAKIAKQKFARGGMVPFNTGGVIQGSSHASGGVPFLAGGRLMEAEGGELIVNKGIWKRPDLVQAISEMNALTGGQRFFATGGIVPLPAAPPIPVSHQSSANNSMDMDALIRGLRGVLAEEVGSLQITNNVVDTSAQQASLTNQQTYNSF